MAEDRLFPNGDDGGWNTGGFGDIDETLALFSDSDFIADGTPGTPVAEGGVVVLDLTSTIVVDADTVTRIDVIFRARDGNASALNSISVDLLIGGVPQGSAVSQNTDASFTEYTANDTGWNVDRSASDLNGMQIRLTTTQTGMPTDDNWDVSVMDVVITYTPSAAGQLHSHHKNLNGLGVGGPFYINPIG